jgi:hypothetical protein
MDQKAEDAIDEGIEAAAVHVASLADKTWGGREFNIAKVAATAAVRHYLGETPVTDAPKE